MTPDELMERILSARGLNTAKERDDFLRPRYESLSDPFLMHDMARAVDRILDAMDRGERICVYSDYDADGVPGAVIFHDFFGKVGYANVRTYIPHRHAEGYGVHRGALDQLVEEGVKLVITVDVGIAAVDEVAHANAIGLEVIVTDHHEPLETLPEAFAIVNPKLGEYPDRMLCGAGTAFRIVQALLTRRDRLAELSRAGKVSGGEVPDGWEKWLLDMAGLATLSDMVPLVNENRVIAYYGMKVLGKARRPGLRALFQKSGISLANLTEDDIVFSVTPRLNAASRMAHPDDAFDLLAAKDAREGALAAEHLSRLNDDRKKIVSTIMRDVHHRVGLRVKEQTLRKILVIGDPKWPAGVLGLVASKIVDEYGVTTFVWGSEEESIKGSCRGIGDVAVVKLMQRVTHLLTQFGGHEDAGGFTATRETIHFLEDEFNAHYPDVKHEVSREKGPATHDLELSLSDVTMEHYRALRALAPFGMGNPKPVFAFRGIRVESVKPFGKTREHLEIVFLKNRPDAGAELGMRSASSARGTIRAISWYAKADSFTEPVEDGKEITLLAEFDYSVFMGRSELRLRIVDVLPSAC